MPRPEFLFLSDDRPSRSRARDLYDQGRLLQVKIGWGVELVWLLPCEHCGCDFEHANTQVRYCSPKCKTEGQRAKGRARVAAHRQRRAVMM